ncbi:kinase-like domain-containing protein [Chlamydoabsidia padenii]|nr:kinase-like domain-containing protein [Chlamydoabsidia padenii]
MASPAAILSRQRSNDSKSMRDRRKSSGTISSSSQHHKPRKYIGDYYVGKTLGKGASGRVKLGIHKHTGEQVAIKIISKAHLAANPAIEKAVRREIAIMKLIRHPNVMALVDVIDDPNSSDINLILEHVQGGELFEYLVSKGRLSDNEARRHFQQIILGLDFCHHHLICHRDLKPENLLLDHKNNIKIADFGMASLQPSGSMLETSCGSPHYASPEIVAGMPYNGSASDIWSCGVILYALLTGHLPFDDENIRQLLKKVKAGKYAMPDDISRNAQDLIRRILVVDPSKRLTMDQIMAHPWFCESEPVNLATLPIPPTANEIGRPVWNSSEIDDRILETIKFLWGETQDDVVVHALVSKEHNMQKVVYVLLQQHSERYWQKDHDDEDLRDNDRHYQTIGHRTERNRRYRTIPEFMHPPPLPPLPLMTMAHGGKSQIKKSETFYSRFIKNVLTTRRQSKPSLSDVLPDTTCASSDPSGLSRSKVGTKTQDDVFLATSSDINIDNNSNAGTCRLNNSKQSGKTLNTKRLSIRVPNAFRNENGTHRFGFTMNGSRRQRKELDMNLFQTQYQNSVSSTRNHEALDSDLTPPPALSDGSTLSNTSLSTNSTRDNQHHQLNNSNNITERRGSSISHTLNRPITPSLLSNNSTITTTSGSGADSIENKSSWLTNLFFFKQPKAEIKTTHLGKTRQVKCRLEIMHSNSAHNIDRSSRLVQFTQQQGDGTVMTSVIRQLQRLLDQEYPTTSSAITAGF